tara:strand:- start:1 stop:222 length:222 start_codon:yes stop_codon:yes gene_type:complete
MDWKKLIREEGKDLLVIIVLWEVIELLIFPPLIYYLGTHLNPIFLGFVPLGFFICVHPIAVPIIFAVWKKIRN